MQLVSLSCPYNDTALFTPFSHQNFYAAHEVAIESTSTKYVMRFVKLMLIQFFTFGKFYAPMVTRVFEQFTLSRL